MSPVNLATYTRPVKNYVYSTFFVSLFSLLNYRALSRGAGIAQCLEHRTCDWKWNVLGWSPGRSSGEFSSPESAFSVVFRVNFLCRLIFCYPVHPCATTIAHKYAGHLAKSAMQLSWIAVCGFAWSDVNMVVWCMQNALRWQQFHVAPVM